MGTAIFASSGPSVNFLHIIMWKERALEFHRPSDILFDYTTERMLTTPIKGSKTCHYPNTQDGFPKPFAHYLDPRTSQIVRFHKLFSLSLKSQWVTFPQSMILVTRLLFSLILIRGNYEFVAERAIYYWPQVCGKFGRLVDTGYNEVCKWSLL